MHFGCVCVGGWVCVCAGEGGGGVEEEVKWSVLYSTLFHFFYTFKSGQI